MGSVVVVVVVEAVVEAVAAARSLCKAASWLSLSSWAKRPSPSSSLSSFWSPASSNMAPPLTRVRATVECVCSE